MDLMEDWEGGSEAGLDDALSASMSGTAAGNDLFDVELVRGFLTRGRGVATQVHVRGNACVVTTSRNWLLRHDLSDAAAAVVEVELRKSLDGRLGGTWVDAAAARALAVVSYGSVWETYLLEGTWKKARLLHKVGAGVRVTSVGWLPPAAEWPDADPESGGGGGGGAWAEAGGPPAPSASHDPVAASGGGAASGGFLGHLSDRLGAARGVLGGKAGGGAGSGGGEDGGGGGGGLAGSAATWGPAGGPAHSPHRLDALLGTEGGSILRCTVDAAGKERVATLFSPHDARDARVEGVEIVPLPGGRMGVLVLTRARLCVFVGPRDPERLFVRYRQPFSVRAIDLPGDPGPGALRLRRPAASHYLDDDDDDEAVGAAVGGRTGGWGAGGGRADARPHPHPTPVLAVPDAFSALCPAGLYYGRLDERLLNDASWVSSICGEPPATGEGAGEGEGAGAGTGGGEGASAGADERSPLASPGASRVASAARVRPPPHAGGSSSELLFSEAPPRDELSLLRDHHVLPSALVASRAGDSMLDAAQSRHHFVVLFSSRLSFVNVLSKRVAQDVPLDRLVGRAAAAVASASSSGAVGGGGGGGAGLGAPPLEPGGWTGAVGRAGGGLLPPSDPPLGRWASLASSHAPPAGPLAHGGAIAAGLAPDPVTGQVYAWVGESLFELGATNEDRDMWKVLLSRGEYAQARAAARTQQQRNEVALAAGEALLAEGDAEAAARELGRITSADPTFEEICLRLSGHPSALTIFLETRLDTLGPADAPQATMLATWLVELLTDRLNAAELRKGAGAWGGVAAGSGAGESDGDDAGRDGGAHDGRDGRAGGDPAEPGRGPSASLGRDLRRLLETRTSVLDPATTRALLVSCGRQEDLVAFYRARGDMEAVLELLLEAGGPGAARRAAAVLRDPSVPREAHYRSAPSLAALDPDAAADSWLAAHPPLDPARLLPALLEMSASGHGEAGRAGAGAATAAAGGPEAALRFVRQALRRAAGGDAAGDAGSSAESAAAAASAAASSRALHDLAVDLLSRDAAREQELIDHLALARTPLGAPGYDPVRALRLARSRGLVRASVALFCELGMLEDAVDAALPAHPQLALEIAHSQGHDPDTSRRLWLRIARYRIARAREAAGGGDGAGDREDDAAEQGGSGPGAEAAGPGAPSTSSAASRAAIEAVTSLLEDAHGALRIEDVLELFPGFVEIDAFKSAICASLEGYKREIEELKREMEASSATALEMRRSLRALGGRAARVDLGSPCARCGAPVGLPPPLSAGPSGGAVPRFVLFPTGNAFHGSCLAAEAAACAPPAQARRIEALAAQLALAAPGGGHALLDEFRAEALAEDPYWGEGVLRVMAKPFVAPGERELAVTWDE